MMIDETKYLRQEKHGTAKHSRLIWILLAVWLAYSGGVLWKLNEVSPWQASLCIARR